MKASPAPVVSAACTEIAEKCWWCLPLINRAPFSPSVMTTCFTPRRRSTSATTSGSAAAWGERPANTLASVSLGVSTSTRLRTEGARGRTGAGFRIVTAPTDRPRASALSAAATGISNWVRTTLAEFRTRSACDTSVGVSNSFAPGSIAMEFCPVPASTMMKPTPVGASAERLTKRVSMPSWRYKSSAMSPKGSLPMRATKSTCAPSRAQPTA